ncbi:VOC family protein [Roseibacillus persicicus]|uniref:Glyoxalase n=1 Tax=Roseibacillus persicicus TaxID=454148 RepID=A0A918TI05_9BACT|nr:VOC family protein [Roseibacillus persicicus]GHC48577.1 glyoxalase [Roseibacillus persicicus]
MSASQLSELTDSLTDMSNIQNALNWFEIYVADLSRAKSFYQKVLDITMAPMESETCEGVMFPYEEGIVSGGLLKVEHCQPGPGGTLVYLNADGKLDAIIARIKEAGGKMVLEKMEIPPHGFIAVFEDCEGNHVGLHSIS